jgi:isopentenyl-diphosphate delta-isomerase
MSSFSHSSGGVLSHLGGDDEQSRYMNEEFCIVVDENDQVIGQGSKKDCHAIENIAPGRDAAPAAQSAVADRALLHRAFSVFLFNERGELLLQQRARTKPTFASHYTNTCCSHPLTVILAGNGVGSECDWTAAEQLQALGVKRAAIRKLEHELGIRAGEIPLENFHLITKIYYWAPDRVNTQWGEHEIDYILFVKTRESAITLKPNPSEVDDVKWVSHAALTKWMYGGTDAAAAATGAGATVATDSNSTLWTPWFSLMCERFLFSSWWPALERIVRDDGFGNTEAERTEEKRKIYRLTAPPARIADSVPQKFQLASWPGRADAPIESKAEAAN